MFKNMANAASEEELAFGKANPKKEEHFNNERSR